MDLEELFVVLDKTKSALGRLEELVYKSFNSIEWSIVRDAKIKRFEFCFEMFWKLLQKYLTKVEFVDCYSPRSCFREAFKVGLCTEKEVEECLNMVKARNYIVHMYNEKLADAFVERLGDYFNLMSSIVNRIENRLKESKKF